MIYSLIGYACLVLLIGIYVLYSLRLDTWRKWLGPLGYMSIVGLSLLVYNQTLGFCKPTWMRIVKEDINVLALAIEEPKNIYIWGSIAGTNEPVCYIFPYSEENVKQAQEGEEEAEKSGGTLVFGEDSGGEMSFYPKPIEALPEKGIAP